MALYKVSDCMRCSGSCINTSDVHRLEKAAHYTLLHANMQIA